MTEDQIRKILAEHKSGTLSEAEALARLRTLPFEDLGFANVDHHRSLRQGFPEVIFGAGKTIDQVEKIVEAMYKHREGQNAVLGYQRHDNGALTPLPGNPFYTEGTGIDNDTHGKLGPNDNDTPLIISPDCKRLFTVNTHSNTIAVFDILSDGSLGT